MKLFPFVRPHWSLSISEDALWHVGVAKRWGTYRIREMLRQPLPAGLVDCSPTAINITDSAAFLDILKSITPQSRGPKAIALSLPDVCARCAIFVFSSFPTNKGEQEALLRWRFQQDYHISAAQSRLGFRVYHESDGRQRPHTRSTCRVLAVSIQQDIVEQYEQACLDAGLLPVSVGVASLQVFDACREIFKAETEQRSSSSKETFPDEAIGLFVSEWGFTCLVLKNGLPAFVRVKRIPGLGTRAQATTFLKRSTSTGDAPDERMDFPQSNVEISLEPDAIVPWREEMRKALTHEFVATVQYYFELAPDPDRKSRPIPVYAVDALAHEESLLPSTEPIQQILESSNPDAPMLRIVPISRDHLASALRTPSFPPAWNQSALAALAGVMMS